MRIGQLAQLSGVSRRALRYYEEQGLLTCSRDASGYRDFAEDAPVLVAAIQVMYAFGLNSAAVRRFLPCARGADEQLSLQMCPQLRATLTARRREVAARIAELSAQQRALEAHLPS
ncbi:MerR family DNA-binding transcriptional regulator [Paenibacillus sp. TRM 82003]|uniref:MerR family DNA-binding transcriptional regulator n=1 Tax=Kineococcus sp. TRM81007 TaxID=2925831 RepID=UPI001F585770|nr:MerR family DNA-binding transcriptional regulator [Kineococcus sp. TRM81007]MCI2240451.1 MerR family DNA-binding transcriptional regulator [Kineococcus sp. TRM81007]MCI3927371.1 MerR family DNA-binding transcriptional regulator [Paenibacillus sp. TRM 82003]